MDRVNKILNHETYRNSLNKIKFLEKDRAFCNHNIEHFLNVARICYIINLERNLGFSKEILYTIALLHDIGRVEQYENGTPHEIASYKMAEDIIKYIDFTESERALIKDGILGHRKEGEASIISNLIYEGDKLSRECHSCSAISLCNWKDEKKNMKIKY